MRNQAQLIAYADRFSGGTFRDLQALIEGPLAGAFGGVHVLPFFHPIDGADAGFDPIDHSAVDPRLGTWDDVAALAAATEVMADVIVNHVSIRSLQFLDFDRRGDQSPEAGLFLTYSRVFPDGARESDLRALHLLRPSLPFRMHRTARGTHVLLWTTFTSEQIDIDVRHPAGRHYLTRILGQLHAAGIRAVRLDAVGHAVKVAGTRCFMIPETFAFIAELTAEIRALGMEVLVEIHGHHQDQIEAARRVDWVYDFALPPLVLHTLYTRSADRLVRWLAVRLRNAVNVLDTHDGIGIVDVRGNDERGPGLLEADEIEALVDTIHQRSSGDSRLASGSASSNLDTSQVNCTFYDALGRRDAEYLIARAIQCFVPGIPQIYYVGLLAGTNDMELLRRTGVGRDINRHYYTRGDVHEQLERPVVQSLLALLRLRNQHRSFGGAFRVVPSPSHRIALEWEHDGERARLDVDLSRMTGAVTLQGVIAWQTAATG
jgi:sucrose phosphorylase